MKTLRETSLDKFSLHVYQYLKCKQYAMFIDTYF